MIGVAVGFGIYVINYYVFAPLLFPWLSVQRSGLVPTLIHPVFGLVAAAAYLKLRRVSPSEVTAPRAPTLVAQRTLLSRRLRYSRHQRSTLACCF